MIPINCVLDTFAQIAALDQVVLIMDIAMGEQAGWKPFKRLLVEARTTGILMLVISTASSLAERAQEQASQYGNLCYQAKPASFDWILAPIRDMIERASPSPS